MSASRASEVTASEMETWVCEVRELLCNPDDARLETQCALAERIKGQLESAPRVSGGPVWMEQYLLEFMGSLIEPPSGFERVEREDRVFGDPELEAYSVSGVYGYVGDERPGALTKVRVHVMPREPSSSLAGQVLVMPPARETQSELEAAVRAARAVFEFDITRALVLIEVDLPRACIKREDYSSHASLGLAVVIATIGAARSLMEPPESSVFSGVVESDGRFKDLHLLRSKLMTPGADRIYLGLGPTQSEPVPPAGHVPYHVATNLETIVAKVFKGREAVKLRRETPSWGWNLATVFACAGVLGIVFHLLTQGGPSDFGHEFERSRPVFTSVRFVARQEPSAQKPSPLPLPVIQAADLLSPIAPAKEVAPP